MVKKKNKIMFFVYILGQGGAEKVIATVLNNINYDKYEIYLTLGVREGNTYLNLLKNRDKLKINYLDVPLGMNEKAHQKLAEYIDKFDIDVLITEAYFTNTLAYHASKLALKKVKLIFSEVTIRSRRTSYKYGFKEILKTFLRYNFSASAVIAVSEGVKKDLNKRYGVMKRKIHLIYNPIDIDECRKMSKENIDDDIFNSIKTKKIVNVARLTSCKNQTVLLDAFKNLLERRKDISLVFIGTGELEQFLKDYCKNNDITHVYFLGFKDNPHKYVKNSDVFVLSSNVEGFGNVIVEAMGVGIPVVSTNCEGPKEILKNDSGLLVSIGDSNEMAKTINAVLDDKKLRKKLVENASKVIDKYDAKNIITEYEKLIDEIID